MKEGRYNTGNEGTFMPGDTFTRALTKARQIKITVIGRNSGRTITVPVWFVHEADALGLLPVHGARTQWYKNLQQNQTITIQAGKEQRTFKATMLKSPSAVGKVVRSFCDKYTPDMVTKLYPGPLDAAVKIKL
jgi:hypothetical protein